MSNNNNNSDKDYAVYNIHRDYVKHEDTLINYRTTWLITIQSFLLATFGFSYQKYYEISFQVVRIREELAASKDIGAEMTVNPRWFWLFLLWLTLVGLTVAIASFFSIKAAADALNGLRKNWRRYLNNADGVHPVLPNLTGGGHDQAHKHGYMFAGLLPLLFIVLWIFVAAVLIIGAVKDFRP